MTKDVLLERFASPFHRTLRVREKLLTVTGNTRRARLLSKTWASESDTPVFWQNVAMMLAAEERVSK